MKTFQQCKTDAKFVNMVVSGEGVAWVASQYGYVKALESTEEMAYRAGLNNVLDTDAYDVV